MTIGYVPGGGLPNGGATEVAWNHLGAERLRTLAQQDAIVLLPAASTEQHGPHLPTGVDDILCGSVCRRVAELLNPDVPAVVAPTLWCGLADHHVAFGGTFTLSLATYQAVLGDLCRSILGAGFRRIVIVNGHGGNVAALAAIVIELTRVLAAPIALTSYFAEGTQEAAAILEDQTGVAHACEAETSMMMALVPDLVDHTRLAEAHGPSLSAAGVLSASLQRARSFRERTSSGVAGDARRASPDKGRALIAAYATALADRLRAGEPWN